MVFVFMCVYKKSPMLYLQHGAFLTMTLLIRIVYSVQVASGISCMRTFVSNGPYFPVKNLNPNLIFLCDSIRLHTLFHRHIRHSDVCLLLLDQLVGYCTEDCNGVLLYIS